MLLKRVENLIKTFIHNKNNKRYLNKYLILIQGVLYEFKEKAEQEELEQTYQILFVLINILTTNNINDMLPEQIEIICCHILYVLNKWENVTREINTHICKDLLKYNLVYSSASSQ